MTLWDVAFTIWNIFIIDREKKIKDELQGYQWIFSVWNVRYDGYISWNLVLVSKKNTEKSFYEFGKIPDFFPEPIKLEQREVIRVYLHLTKKYTNLIKHLPYSKYMQSLVRVNSINLIPFNHWILKALHVHIISKKWFYVKYFFLLCRWLLSQSYITKHIT